MNKIGNIEIPTKLVNIIVGILNAAKIIPNKYPIAINHGVYFNKIKKNLLLNFGSICFLFWFSIWIIAN